MLVHLEGRILTKSDGSSTDGDDKELPLDSDKWIPSIELFQNTRKEKDGYVSFYIGEQILEEVIPGLNLVAKSMKTGEICEARIKARFAFGEKGLPDKNVPPNANVEYRVELLRIGDFLKEPAEMSPHDALLRARKLKSRGKEFYVDNDYARGQRNWKEAIRYCDCAMQTQQQQSDGKGTEVEKVDEKELEELFQIRLACTNNIAAVLEKQGMLKESKEACVEVLQADPRNIKALVRAARIASQQGLFEEATLALKVALEASPNDASVREEVARFKKVRKEYEEKSKKAFGGMLAKPSSAATASADKNEISESKSTSNQQEKENADSLSNKMEKGKESQLKIKEETKAIEAKSSNVTHEEEEEEDDDLSNKEKSEGTENKLVTMLILLAPSMIAIILSFIYLLLKPSLLSSTSSASTGEGVIKTISLLENMQNDMHHENDVPLQDL